MCVCLRAADQVVLLHRAQEHSGQGAQGRDVLPGEPREGQPAERAGEAPLPPGPHRGAAVREP